MKTLSGSLMIACVGCLVCPAVAPAQEWTRFRGPNGTGLSNATTIPGKWTDKDYNWKVKIPGIGHSSPVVWGKRIFITSGDSKAGTRMVLCIDADDGRILWKKEFESASYRMHLRNSVATSTPTVDAERLYLAWATPDRLSVMAMDHDGNLLWETPLGPYKSQHGFGVSPILFDDLVILGNDQDGTGSLLALDQKTGKVRWTQPRRSGNATYSTPCVYRRADGTAELIFTNWQHGVTAVDPKTGQVNWELSVFEPGKKERAVASPVVAGDLVLGTCGFVTAQKHFVAVRPGNAMTGTKPEEVWRVERAVAYMPTPLVKENRVYLCSEQGLATCLNLADGKIVWQERIPGSYSASPVCVGDFIYCVSNDGVVNVLKAADTFELVARNSLGEPTQSTPAIANGRMILRTESHLLSLGGKK